MTVLQAILARTRRRSGSSHVSILARAWQVGGLPFQTLSVPLYLLTPLLGTLAAAVQLCLLQH